MGKILEYSNLEEKASSFSKGEKSLIETRDDVDAFLDFFENKKEQPS